MDLIIGDPIDTTHKCMYWQTTSGLELKSQHMDLSCSLIRFTTIEALHAFTGLVSETALASQRKQMKNMILNENDEVNVISGSSTASTVFKLCPKEHGIDLEYDG